MTHDITTGRRWERHEIQKLVKQWEAQLYSDHPTIQGDYAQGFEAFRQRLLDLFRERDRA